MSKGFLARIVIVCLASGCAPPYYRPVPVYDRAPPPHPATPPVSVEDVITLSKAGISEEIILAKIQTVGVSAKPSTEQIVVLKQAGVSDRVIEAMLTARGPIAVAPERPVIYYRYEYYPRWYYGPWWYGWPYPFWHLHFHWRFWH